MNKDNTQQLLSTLHGRLAYIKGILSQTSPMLDEAYQEIFADLIWAITEDQKEIEETREALKERA